MQYKPGFNWILKNGEIFHPDKVVGFNADDIVELVVVDQPMLHIHYNSFKNLKKVTVIGIKIDYVYVSNQNIEVIDVSDSSIQVLGIPKTTEVIGEEKPSYIILCDALIEMATILYQLLVEKARDMVGTKNTVDSRLKLQERMSISFGIVNNIMDDMQIIHPVI